MNRIHWCAVFGLLLLQSAPNLPAGEYADPDGAFTLSLPDGWVKSREALPDVGGWFSSFGAREDADAPHIEIVAIPLTDEIRDQGASAVAADLFGLVLENIAEENGEIRSQKTSSVKWNGFDAMRCDMTFRASEKGKVESGSMFALWSRRHALLIARSALQADEAGQKELEKVFATLSVDGRKAAVAADTPVPPKPSPTVRRSAAESAQSLARNPKRPEADSVLAAGDPPLTHGSVASFVTLLGFVFDVQLTEAEFELTKQRFIEFYNRNDEEGRRIIALGGQSILDGLRKGTDEEKARNKAEVKAVMAQRFANGAKAGMEWAAALHEAIQRRGQTVTRTLARKPEQAAAGNWDTVLSQSDLDAAVEMLGFMWVASGRDPALVTAEATVSVRQALATNFQQFSPDFQYALCSAEKVYAQMRGVYQNAGPAERTQLARHYAQALDELGLTVPTAGGGGGGSAWDDMRGKDESSVRAELMMSYAGSAATSTSFSGRTVTW